LGLKTNDEANTRHPALANKRFNETALKKVLFPDIFAPVM
jgi:hypothetical protein